MRLVIRGHHLPGRKCGPYNDIHVGLQVGRDPEGLVPGDADGAEWVAEIRIDDSDFRGPAVQGRKGARHVYLTGGTPYPEELTKSPSRPVSPTTRACRGVRD